METLCALPNYSLDAEHERSQQSDTSFVVSFNISLNADRRRIFHVLTIAEYMETWLVVPGRQCGSPLHVTNFPNGFHVQYVDVEGVSQALVASFQTFRTAKTKFLWSRTGVRESLTSVVRIRLIGDFERTTLSLTHNGLSSEPDRNWHAQLWDQSLKRLSSLFELQ
jgi:Activator of Hsp90 ATPase homolog 1-like protein.